MAEGVILRSSFGRSIRSPRHASSGKGFGLGTVDIRPVGLEGHYRTNLEKLLGKMGQHVEQSMIIMAKMEYAELMKIEKKLKELDSKLFQKTSEAKPKPNNHLDEQWGPQLFHLIQKSRETQLKNMSDDALRELNALQRSARAYEEATKSSADGSPREIKMIPNLSGSILMKRRPSSGNKPYSHPYGSPMKAIHPVQVSTKALHPDNTDLIKNPDFSKSFIRSPSQDSNINRSASRPPSQGYKSVHRGGSISISKEEYDRLQRKVKQQDNQIEELTTRLSSFASKQLLDGNPHMADLSDKNRPTKIGEKFGELYDEEWSDAFDAFHTQLKYTEEKCLRVLLRILKYAYDFCKKSSERQLQDLIISMKTHILDPVPLQNKSPANSTTSSLSQVNFQLSGSEGKALQSVCHRHSKDLRKAAGPKSVPLLQEVFKEQVLRQNFQLEPRQLPKPILAYIDACVEITWLMCIQDPPMVITWATEGEPINTSYYKLFQTSGSIVRTCVWPVLLLHNRGPIVSKGYVLPQKR